MSRAAVIPIIASACVMLAGCSGAAGLDARYAREVQMEARSDGKAVVRVVIARRAPDLRAAHEDAPAEYNAWIARRRGGAEGRKLIPAEVGRENKRELKPDAAYLLLRGLGVDSSSQSHDAKGGFAGLCFCGGNGHIKFDKLQRPRVVSGINFFEREPLRSMGDVGGRGAHARNFFGSKLNASVDLGDGFKNELLEVQG